MVNIIMSIATTVINSHCLLFPVSCLIIMVHSTLCSVPRVISLAGGGAPGHHLVQLCPVLHAGKELPYVLFLFFARALRDFPANVPLLFYSSASWNSPPSTHQMLH